MDQDNAYLRVGCLDGNNHFLAGKISEVIIYDRALQSNEVYALYQSKVKYSVVTDGMIGYWRLDDLPNGSDINGNIFKDISGNGNHLVGVDADNDSKCIAEEVLSYPE